MKKALSLMLALMLVFALAAPAAHADGRVLRWNEVNGETYGATVAAHAFADKLAEISGGALTIELYTNGTLGSEAESMQGIQMGTLDIFRGNASSLPNYGAEVIGSTGLPYVFKDMAQFEEVAESELGDKLLQSVADADCGYIALGWLVEGPRSLFITPSVYEKLGKPESFSFDMMNGLKIRVPETAPYFITDAHTFGCGVILVSEDTWNSLSEEEQGWMKEAALEARSVCYEYNQKQEQACFDSFEEKGIKRLDVTDIEKWQEACAPLYGQQSEEVQAIIAQIQGGEY